MRRHSKLSLIRAQSGLALVTVLTLTFVLMVLAGIVLDLSLKEIKTTAARRTGGQSFYVAEGGAVAARSALMAFVGADPKGCAGCATLDPALPSSSLTTWYAAGVAGNQTPLQVLNWITVDSLKFNIPLTDTAPQFNVNWALSTTHLKLQYGGPTISNTIGNGTYTSWVKVQPWSTPDGSCSPFGSACPIHLGQDGSYEFFFTYSVTSDGQSGGGRRRITFAGNFSIKVTSQSFAQFALMTDVHLTPGGGAIWFVNATTFDGPVHTNGEFRFAFFPQFGTPDTQTPCSVSRVVATPLTSVSGLAWFNNGGAPVELAVNENVVSGTRVDAPVMPGCDPSNVPNNGAANFTRGVPAVTMPNNPYSQQGVAVGLDQSGCTPSCPAPTDAQVAAVIPELQVAGCPPTCGPAPNGIYIPRSADLSGSMSGGIYVQGNLDSLSLSYTSTLPCTATSCGVYTLTQGTQTVTVTVDRTARNTTVTNSNWPPASQTRTFSGVPKGFQGPGNNNGTILYVGGGITAISGTLGSNEQTTVAATGTINITNNLVYQSPPVVTDPTSNPMNVLGLYSNTGDITIDPAAPNDVNIHAVLMAGSSGNLYNSSVNVTNYNLGVSRGQVHLIGGVIEQYYGPFGTFDPSTGAILTGYGRDFKYDRRMSRGFNPPYFPTTGARILVQGTAPLAGTKPTWREAPPQ